MPNQTVSSELILTVSIVLPAFWNWYPQIICKIYQTRRSNSTIPRWVYSRLNFYLHITVLLMNHETDLPQRNNTFKFQQLNLPSFSKFHHFFDWFKYSCYIDMDKHSTGFWFARMHSVHPCETFVINPVFCAVWHEKNLYFKHFYAD